MTIYLDLYLTVNTTRGLRSWVSHSESLAPSKSIMSSFNCNTWGHVLRGFFFFLALLVSNLLAPTWSVALMKTSYHTVIWMNLKILEGCSACWTKLSNNLCAWISYGLHFSEIIIKIQGYILFVLGNTLVWIKIFNLVFSITPFQICLSETFPYGQKYVCFVKYVGHRTLYFIS